VPNHTYGHHDCWTINIIEENENDLYWRNECAKAVKAMLGLLKRSDVERAMKEARRDFYASNIEALSPNSTLSIQLLEIAKKASKAARPKVRRLHQGITLSP
jgi:hypothetical protein